MYNYCKTDLLNCNTHQTTLKSSKKLPSYLYEMYFETSNFCLEVLIKAIHVPGHFSCTKSSSHSAASRTLLSVLWHDLVTPAGANDNRNTHGSEKHLWTNQERRRTRCKRRNNFVPFGQEPVRSSERSLGIIGGLTLVCVKLETKESGHCLFQYS